MASSRRNFNIREQTAETNVIKSLIRKAVRAVGYDIVRSRPTSDSFPTDISANDRTILAAIREFSMTSIDRQISLINAVRFLSRNRICGSIVECGVWRGGSSMAAALTLQQERDAERDLYLYDTFEGMTPPSDLDSTADGVLAQEHLDRDVAKVGYWCVASLDDVRRNMTSTGYDGDRVHYIQGPVEQTIPVNLPRQPIALLRLDTDWYESTRHELDHLFPLLVEGGVLIIDDYGHWAGARKAVDEYFDKLPQKFFLHRVDYTCRLLIKK